MNNRTHINNELQSVAPGLLNIPLAMPYMLPPAYFSGLAAEVFATIKKREELPEVLIDVSRTTPYTVPADFFKQFPERMLQRLHKELLPDQESTLLNAIARTVPYTVPSGYFEAFPITILQKVKEAQQQTVPTGYFESLPDLMLAKVRKLDTSVELEEVAPLLNTISKQPVQYVPTGYFENLTPALNVQTNSATPVASIKPKSNWLRYAAAACLVGALGFGTYRYFNFKMATPSIVNQPSATSINNELASIDAAAIEQYLQNNSSSLESHMAHYNNVQVDDLDDLMLEDFSDQQLQKSLEEAPELPGLPKAQKI